MSIIFDKKRLHTDEFARYIYTGKGTRDMSLEGYRYAMAEDLAGTQVKDVKLVAYDIEKQGINAETYKSANVWAAVVVSVKVKSGEVYEACGDANYAELSVRQTSQFLVRIAESRARKRAFAQALGITPDDFVKEGVARSRMEDIDTPLTDLAEDEAEGRQQAKQRSRGPSLEELRDL